MANSIHATAIIEGEVDLGEDNVIGPYCVLIGPIRIGSRNRIGPHVCIGTPGQDTRRPLYDASSRRIEIGDDNIIREFTAIQKGVDSDLTSLGSRNYLMQSVHIPHDARIQDDVTLTPMCVLAGNAKLLRGANLGLGVTVHQHSVVGHYTMVAMNAVVAKNIRPFTKYIPQRPLSVNSYALSKFGLLEHAAEVEAYVLEGRVPTSGPIGDIVQEFERLHALSGRPVH